MWRTGTATPGRARRRCGRRSGSRAHPSSAPRGRAIPPEPANRAPAARGGRTAPGRCPTRAVGVVPQRRGRWRRGRPRAGRRTRCGRRPVRQLRSEPPSPWTNTTSGRGSSTRPSGHGSPRWNSCMAMARSLPVSCSSSPTAALSAASVESPREGPVEEAQLTIGPHHPASDVGGPLEDAVDRADRSVDPTGHRVVDAAHPAGARPQGIEHPVGHRLVHAGDRRTTGPRRPPPGSPTHGRRCAKRTRSACLDEQLDEVVDAPLRPVLVRAEGQVLDDEGEHQPDDGAGDRR